MFYIYMIYNINIPNAAFYVCLFLCDFREQWSAVVSHVFV